MPLKIIRNDITKMRVDAIVDPANPNPTYGSGCDAAIYEAAGKNELLKLRAEIGAKSEGSVFITPALKLDAKYIIHAVSPLYRGGFYGEEKKLRNCYIKSLALAKEYKINSIAFPLLAAGSYGCPREIAMRVALDEINAFLSTNDMLVYLVVFDTGTSEISRRMFGGLDEYIDANYVDEALKKETVNENISRQRFGRPVRRAALESDIPLPIEAMSVYAAGLPKPTLDERVKHLSDTFSEYLLFLIKQKGLKNADVYKNAIVDKKVFSKIKSNPNYHPAKPTALCLCMGAMLNIDQTKDLLARAGYALSPCDMSDVIFSFFIENELYSVVDLCIELDKRGLPSLFNE